jgi:hypothetical protein
VGVSLLGAVVVMALLVPEEPLGIDQRWSEAMLDIRTSPLTDLALVFNWLGRGLGWACWTCCSHPLAPAVCQQVVPGPARCTQAT